MSRTGFYPCDKPYELIVFDVRRSGALERLISLCAAWGEGTTLELLGPCHAALIIRAGGAARLRGRKQT